MAEPAVAVDCGSNSTRSLIVDAAGRTLERTMTITRLSEGVDETGELNETAIGRTLAVLGRVHESCEREGVTRGLLVATSAVRDARNGAAFLARAHDVVGFATSVLSGAEEAAYAYAGATADLPPSALATMIVDVGGGSTELAVEHGGRLVSYSMQLGCVRVSERALGRGPVTPEGVAAARAMIDEELERAFVAEPAFGEVASAVRLVGLAGTVATLAQLDAGLDHYDRDAIHHRRLTRELVVHWRDLLGRETPEVRLTHPGMVPGREDVLVAGLYVLDAVMDRLGVQELLSSESDLLDGVVASLQRS